jgi:hypothetical protein
MRLRSVLIVAAVVAALLGTPRAASAHGSTAYVATVRGIVPPLAGVDVRIDHGFQLALTNRSAAAVVVYGPNGAPYLRFTRAGVAANLGGWTLITPRRTFAWPVADAAEPKTPPLVVRREPGKSHHLRDWRVQLRTGGRSYAIVGSLDYRVAGTDLAELLFPLAPVPLLMLLAVGVVRRARS